MLNHPDIVKMLMMVWIAYWHIPFQANLQWHLHFDSITIKTVDTVQHNPFRMN